MWSVAGEGECSASCRGRIRAADNFTAHRLAMPINDGGAWPCGCRCVLALAGTQGKEMVAPARFERATFPLGGGRSIQLSYGARVANYRSKPTLVRRSARLPRSGGPTRSRCDVCSTCNQ